MASNLKFLSDISQANQNNSYTKILQDELVELNVSGQRLTVSKSNLVKRSSFFRSLLSADSKDSPSDDGSYFIDRDPNVFEHILCYLRRGIYPFIELKAKDRARHRKTYQILLVEALYYGIPRLADWIREKKYEKCMEVIETTRIYSGALASVPSSHTSNVKMSTSWITEKVYNCPKGKHKEPASCDTECIACIRRLCMSTYPLYIEKSVPVTTVTEKKTTYNWNLMVDPAFDPIDDATTVEVTKSIKSLSRLKIEQD